MINAENALQEAERLLAPFIKGSNRPESSRLDLNLDAADLVAAAKNLVSGQLVVLQPLAEAVSAGADVVLPPEAMYVSPSGEEQEPGWGYLGGITGLDQGPATGRMEVLYHFCNGPAVLTLRLDLPRDAAVVDSIYDQYPMASFFERELSEMFGVTVNNTPDPSHLFLADDWPDGTYPLRKDFDPANHPISHAVEPEPGPLGDNKFVVPIGPQHPALKEPGHFLFTVDGEMVTAARMRLGYAHRGIEKATESRNWAQNLYLLERICGICSHTHALAYSLGVEKLAGVEAPPRAQAIRQIVAGLERIHSHLLWLGVAAHEAGFDTLFMYSWRDREEVMDILEAVTGNRVNYSVNVLGGVKFDITPELAEQIRRGMDYLEERTRHYLSIVSNDTLFLQRTRGIGTVTKAEALRLGLMGPTARASGVTRDTRVDSPYASYGDYRVNMVTDEGGDLEARFRVRMKELFVTYNAIRMILDHMPEGELTVRMPRKIPAGETISRVEAPRGEVLYFIKSGGGDKPERVKVRTPSLCNWMTVLVKAVGSQLADVPMLISGMDPCFSCNDRMISLARPQSDGSLADLQTWSWEDLRQYGIRYYAERAKGQE